MRYIEVRAWDSILNYFTEVDCACSFTDKVNGVLNVRQGIELTQYTGLKDKNGVKIFEGDVVKWGMNGQECFIRVAEVQLLPCLQFKILHYIEEKSGNISPSNNKTFGYSNFIYKETHKWLEVIGNIYENKDLIK